MAEAVDLLGAKFEDLGSSSMLAGVSIPAIEYWDDGIGTLDIPSAGLSFVLSAEKKISAVHLHSAAHDGYACYQGSLPASLNFEMSRDQVRGALGEPTLSQASFSRDPVLGTYPPWDRFDQDHLALHLEYEFDVNSIRLITIMTMDAAPCWQHQGAA